MCPSPVVRSTTYFRQPFVKRLGLSYRPVYLIFSLILILFIRVYSQGHRGNAEDDPFAGLKKAGTEL